MTVAIVVYKGLIPVVGRILTLQDYPQYKIKRIRGAGYQLVVNSNLCKNGSVGQVDHYKIIVEKILNRLRNCFKCL